MPLVYDRDTLQKWRALAITDPDALQLGETYFGNGGQKITIVGFLTKNDWFDRIGQPTDTLDEEKFVAVDRYGRMHPLRDLNVGASYNPWLLFTEKALAHACKVHLNVKLEQ